MNTSDPGADDESDDDATGEWLDADAHRGMIEELLQRMVRGQCDDDAACATIQELCGVHAGEAVFDDIATSLPLLRGIAQAHRTHDLAAAATRVHELHAMLDASSAGAMVMRMVTGMRDVWNGLMMAVLVETRTRFAGAGGGTAH